LASSQAYFAHAACVAHTPLVAFLACLRLCPCPNLLAPLILFAHALRTNLTICDSCKSVSRALGSPAGDGEAAGRQAGRGRRRLQARCGEGDTWCLPPADLGSQRPCHSGRISLCICPSDSSSASSEQQYGSGEPLPERACLGAGACGSPRRSIIATRGPDAGLPAMAGPNSEVGASSRFELWAGCLLCLCSPDVLMTATSNV